MNLSILLLTTAVLEGVPPNLLLAICEIESGLKPHVTAVKDGGSDSHGLCQIKLSTAEQMGYKGDRKSLYTPEINAKYAAKYLKYQLDRYGNIPHAVAAYNSGTLNLNPKGEIRNLKYVKKVIKTYVSYEYRRR